MTIRALWGRISSSELGQSLGVRLSALVPDSAGSEETSFVLRGPQDTVAPFWPQRPWFPDLLDLVVDGPVQLTLSPDLLGQPDFHCRLLGIRRLSLHAWRLSSGSPGLRVSLPE